MPVKKRCPAGAVLMLSLLCGMVSAQTELPTVPSEPTAPASVSDTLREAKPDVFYLRDKDGNLHPVLGFTLEDFERLLALGSGANSGQSRPGYRLEEVVAEGRISGEHAELALTVTAFVDSEHWVRVPLRMGEALLRSEVKYEGPGEHFLEFDDDEHQYVAWLRGKAEQPHRLSLEALAPIDQLSGRPRLRLSTPRAWTSQLKLEVPLAGATAQVSPGAILEATEATDDGTQFRVMGLGADFSISWWQSAQNNDAQPTVLDATAAISATIDGRSVHTETDLTVQSLGGPFDRFQVRLPRQAALVSSEQLDYVIQPVDEEPSGDILRGQLVEVLLNQSTIGPVTVTLVTERSHDATTPDRWLQLGGFEVIGAVRQWGHVAVVVSSDWQVLWGQSNLLRQVQDLPETLRVDDMVAAFEFFGQPFELQTRIIPRETRISVDPQYVAMVSSGSVQLDARFTYRVSGAKAFSLQIDMPGWEVDEVGPSSLIKADALVMSQAQPLSVPLAQPATGQFELYVRAHRTLPENPTSLDFQLPRPVANMVSGAPVIVQPADNVELAPRESDLVGLLRERGEPPVELAARQQPPWYYRSETAQARFVAEMRVHRRSISVKADSTVTLAGESGTVSQQFTYRVARESLDTAYLDVPAELAASGKLEVTQDGKSLAWLAVGEGLASDVQPDMVQVRVPLAAPQIDTFTLHCSYPLEVGQIVPQATVPLRVPLVMPSEGQLDENVVRVVADKSVKVQSLDGLWTREDLAPAERTDGVQLVLSASVPRRQVALGLRLNQRAADDETIVERAWVQTWLTDQARQDRAVYRLTTRRASLEVTLPSGVTRPEIMLDGQVAAAVEGTGSNQWIVPLAGDGQLHTHVLQIIYRFPERKPSGGGNLSIESPKLENRAWIRRLYWQLVLPRDEHLVAGPASMTPEYRWMPRGLYWGRLPLMDQAQLEAWSGAPASSPLPAGTNQYLFSALGDSQRLAARTMDRSTLVLLSSALVLAIGLTLVYLPLARHPVALLIGAVAVLSTSVIYPEVALVLGQAAALGIALGLLGAVLHRVVSRRHGKLVVRRAPSSVMERGSTQTKSHPELASSPSSTATMTVSHQFPTAESP